MTREPHPALVPVLDQAGNLYLDNFASSKLYGISKTNGAATLIGTLNTAKQVSAMVWTGGQMYAIDFGGDIYSVNKFTAAVSLVSTYNQQNAGLIIAGASTFKAVPEPPAYAVLGVGALVLLRRRQKR